jgi:hypothetical protein
VPRRRVLGRFERTRISPGHQVTIPRDAFSEAALKVGDRLQAAANGTGVVTLTRIEEPESLFDESK